jgi:hypothetical protein
MLGDGAYGEVAYGEPQDNTIPPFQDRNVFAVLALIAEGAGAKTDPSSGEATFGLVASGASGALRPKVKVIETGPQSGRGRTGLSHTGLHNESV